MLMGELLKKYRTEKMKTQKQWVGNVISPSFYAKVEKNIHRITVDDLIELLHYNKISVLDFFSKLERQEQRQNAFKKEITNQIIEAYYHRSKIVAFIYFVTFIACLEPLGINYLCFLKEYRTL